MPTTVFLSYGRGDDEAFVRRLHRDLTEAGFDVWLDRVNMPSRSLTFHQEIADAIRGRDRFLLVVGPAAVASEYVMQEWRYAWEMEKPIVPILRLGDYASIPDGLKIMRLHTEDFRVEGSDSYEFHLQRLVRMLEDAPPVLGKLIAVPSLPPHFIAQDDRLRALKDVLLADLRQPVVITGVAARVGLHGMGGIGKSVLACALARDRDIRRSYPSGIFWLSFGQQPNVVQLQRNVAKGLGDDGAFENEAQGKARLRELLLDKAALFICDDVWDVNHSTAFDVLGPRCRMVITTRDAGLLQVFGAQEYQVQLLSDEEAMALLAKAVGVDPAALPPAAREVAQECDRLPLALALCGGMAFGPEGIGWPSIRDALKDAELEEIATDHPIEGHHGSLWKAIAVSIQQLTPEEQRRWAELSVFPQGEAIPEAAVRTLWAHTGGMSPIRIGHLFKRLAGRSLLHVDGLSGDSSDPKRWFSMHDLLYAYAKRVATPSTHLHHLLVEAYRTQCPEGWESGPDDGYYFQRFPHHLLLSGQNDIFFALVRSDHFVNAQKTRVPDDPALPLQTTLLALKAALEENAPDLIAEFSLRHARRLQSGQETSPLEALQAGQLRQAWRLAGLLEPTCGHAWHILICWELLHAGRTLELAPLLRELLGQEYLKFPEWTTWPGVALAGIGLKMLPERIDVIATKLTGNVQELFRTEVTRLRDVPREEQNLRSGHDMALPESEGSKADVASLGPEERAFRLARISREQMKAGHEAEARATFQQAIQTVRGLEVDAEDQWPRGDFLAHEFYMKRDLLCALARIAGTGDAPELARCGYADAVALVGELQRPPTWKMREFLYERDLLYADLAEQQVTVDLQVEAISTTELIGSPARRDEALVGIISHLAGKGEFDLAFETLAKIEHEKVKGAAMASTTQAQASRGGLPLARARIVEALTARSNLERMEREKAEGEALLAICRRLSDGGALNPAMAISGVISHAGSKVTALAHIAMRYADLGETKTAQAMLLELAAVYERDRALRHLAVAILKTEGLEKALEFVDAHLQETDHCWAFAEFAFVAPAADQRSQCLERALEVARKKREDRHWNDDIEHIVSLLCKHGRVEEATSLDQEGRQTHALRRHMEVKLMESRDYAVLLAACASWPSDHKLSVLRAVARAQYAEGRIEEARKVLSRAVSTAHSKMYEDVVAIALADVAEVFGEIGDPEEARKQFDDAHDGLRWMDVAQVGRRITSLRHIAKKQAAAGLFADARATSKGLVHEFEINACLATIATRQAERGLWTDAWETVSAIVDLAEQSQAIAAIAEAQAKKGLADDAMQSVQRLQSGRDKYVPKVLQVLLSGGHRRHFESLLLTHALSLAAVFEVCGLLMDQYPDAVSQIADVIVNTAQARK